MADDDIHVKGLSQLQALLDTVAPKIERNIMRGALRAGANVIKPVAAANIHSVSGELAKGLRVTTRARGGTVTASLKAGGPHSFVAKWVEHGTRPHTITARDGGALRFGGGFVKSVQHPGIVSPKPFLRPALDSQASAAVIAVGEYIKNRLATKEGLDTADIVIEGDE
ncbi:MAG TPA: HK97-gp10 family putative phage morphogenesis protein [Usitatibacter sp.]|nr:HK97-gp10 family putative phage morphogenesis protein [Usitatibacter sp.]